MQNFFEKVNLLNNSLQKYSKNKDSLLNTIDELSPKNNEEMDTIISELDYINEKINDISSHIDELQYKIDSNELSQTNVVRSRIKEHENNNKIYNAFSPYMLLYSIMLNDERI